MKIMLKPDAAQFLQSLPCNVKNDLISAIREKAQHPEFEMVIVGWTCELPDHIYRAIKWYTIRPGIRAIFYRTQDGITIVRIAWRDCDPYLDQH